MKDLSRLLWFLVVFWVAWNAFPWAVNTLRVATGREPIPQSTWDYRPWKNETAPAR